MSRMLRSEGPECPACGCPMTLTKAGMVATRPWAIYGCEFCGHQMSVGRTPPADGPGKSGPATYRTVRCVCPFCQAINPPVVNTSGSVRWHRCHKCSKTFQSVEDKS